MQKREEAKKGKKNSLLTNALATEVEFVVLALMLSFAEISYCIPKACGSIGGGGAPAGWAEAINECGPLRRLGGEYFSLGTGPGRGLLSRLSLGLSLWKLVGG